MLSDAQIGALEMLHTDGRLSPSAVVEAARPASSPLHNLFEWNNKKAADAYRIEQAREVIRTVEYRFIVREVTIAAPRYVHDPSVGNEQGYTSVEEMRADPTRAWQVTRREINAALGTLKRARSVALALADDGMVASALGRAISDLELLRSRGDMQIGSEEVA